MTLRVFLRAERKTMIAWSVGLALYVLMLGGIYTSFGDPADLDALIENYPEELLQIFGDIEDFSSVEGFMQAELGGFFALVLGIFSVMLMTKHLAGAEERGVLDHLLARPITRTEYYWDLLLAGAVILTVMLLSGAIGGIIGFSLARAPLEDLLGLAGLMVEFLPIGLSYLGLGALLGSAFHVRGPANMAGIAIVIGFWALDVVGRMVDALAWVSYVTPNGYLGRSDLFVGELDLAYVAFTLGLAGITAWVGAVLFERKDVYA